jgi:plastocyanin
MKSNFLNAVSAIILTSMLYGGCTKETSGNDDSNNDPHKIYMKNSVFSNTSLRVTVGTTVTWVNDDTQVHTVTADDGSFHSGDMAVNASFSTTFNTIGTYPYHCNYHSNMTGTIIVVTR